jgi:DNA topoisomerase II
MAQDFVGSNNVNLLVPSGQFGTRLIGGSDSASPRYIFTYLSPITRLLFPEVDEALLSYCEDDGQLIEPYYYCPIIPMLLVNGCQGIGTGWSSNIPPYNPMDVMNYIRAKLKNDSHFPTIRPYARGFTGTIEEKSSGYVTSGRVKKLNKNTISIDELPFRCWTTSYKNFLLNLQQNGVISNFFENHTTTKVSFKVTIDASQIGIIDNSQSLQSTFKLQKSLLTSNMHAFDADGVIRKYDDPKTIADDFFSVRMKLYEDRKSVLESEMQYFAQLARNKAKFIQTVTDNDIDLLSGKKSKQQTVKRLDELGFSTNSDLQTIRNDNAPFRRNNSLVTTCGDVTSGEVDSDNDGLGEYDYLLNMTLSSLTKEKITSLQQEALVKDQELEVTKATTATELWERDLDKLESVLQEFITS